MSYQHPTGHEIRISKNLQRIADKMDKLFIKHTGAPCDFVLNVSSRAARDIPGDGSMAQAPVGSYVSSMTRESAAMLMAELLVKWEMNKDLPPLHLLKDDAGQTLADIIGKQDH